MARVILKRLELGNPDDKDNYDEDENPEQNDDYLDDFDNDEEGEGEGDDDEEEGEDCEET